MSFTAVVRRAIAASSRYSIVSCCRQIRHNNNYAPLCVRSLGTGEIHYCGGNSLPSSFGLLCHFSSSLSKEKSVDAELLQIIKAEIKCAEEERREAEEIPEGFPFEIQDEEGSNIVTLRRDYLGEKIEAVVSMPNVEEPDNNERIVNVKSIQTGDEKINQPVISLTVNISKGKSLNLEFFCTAYSDEIVIDSVSVQRNEKESVDVLAYDGPDFNDLDENLQKAFHKFLEIRGISPATTNFLYVYMISKDDREYSRWLWNLKQFIEK